MLKKIVIDLCKSCHSCQIVGKPNRSITKASLIPIPVIDEPLNGVLIDCVEPLPKFSLELKIINPINVIVDEKEKEVRKISLEIKLNNSDLNGKLSHLPESQSEEICRLMNRHQSYQASSMYESCKKEILETGN